MVRRASILSIGDELLIGQVVNTNASWLGDQLTDRGIAVESILTIGDDVERIVAEIDQMSAASDLLVVGGGLGPTEDDLTREAICRLLGCELVLDVGQEARIERRFAERGLQLNERSRLQAMVPSACLALANHYGSAPGLEFVWNGARVIALPGVPTEFKGILTDEVFPSLEASQGIARTTYLLFGPTESELADRLAELNPLIGGAVTRAFLPSPGGIRVRILCSGLDEADRKRYDAAVDGVRRLAADWIVSDRDETLAAAVGRELRVRGLTLATAESCTGGLLGQLITDVSGSSDYYRGGIVSYANDVKIDALGVPAELIDRHGAVSAEVAEAMAVGAITRLGADVGTGITGIAGPTGGTAEKPVGTVWIAVASPLGVRSSRVQLGRERGVVRMRAANIALSMVWREITGRIAP